MTSIARPEVASPPALRPLSPRLVAAVVVGLSVVFALDCLTHLGFAAGLFYLPVLGLALRAGRISFAGWVTALCVAMVAVGIFTSPPQPDGFAFGFVLANRAGSALALVGVFLVFWHEAWSRTRAAGRLEAARERQEVFEELTDSLPIQIWTASPDGALSYVSAMLVEFSGVSREAILADWLGLLHPEDRGPTTEAWLRAVESGEPYVVEFRVRRSDGVYVWHFTRATPSRDERGEVIRWLGSTINVGQLKSLSEAAENLGKRLTHTLESITDALFILDSECRYTYVNSRAASVFGASPDALLGCLLWEVHAVDRDGPFASGLIAATKEHRRVAFVCHMETLELWLDVRAYPSPEGLTVYFLDVTEERTLREQLQHAQRLEAVGRLTGGIAHDFNNLLTVVLGGADMLGESLHADPTLSGQLRLIVQAAERGAALTRSLLAFSRRQALSPVPTDVRGLVRDMLPILKASLGEHSQLVVAADGVVSRALVDRTQLENALLNLVINARDAMDPGGEVTLTLRDVSLDAGDLGPVAEVSPGEYVEIAVADTGCGIPPDRQVRIFEPFYTTKEPGKGTGLGLSTVFGFVRQSQGHVHVESEVGVGSVFRVYLPRDRSERLPAPAVEASEGAADQAPIVLIVEDDEGIRQLAVAMLEGVGFRTEQADGAEEARRILEREDGISLLFTDVLMPGESGPELVAWVRERRPDLPVLFASGYADQDVFGADKRPSGAGFLRKPYRRDALLRAVRDLLDPLGTP